VEGRQNVAVRHDLPFKTRESQNATGNLSEKTDHRTGAARRKQDKGDEKHRKKSEVGEVFTATTTPRHLGTDKKASSLTTTGTRAPVQKPGGRRAAKPDLAVG